MAGAERLVRVQGSPDLVAEDLTGDVDPVAALEYGALDVRARGRAAAAGAWRICLVDEAQPAVGAAAGPAARAARGGAMTIGGYDVRFPVDTVVVATMNLSEYVGVERLSEALADRFERVRLDYPSAADEVRILRSRATAGRVRRRPRRRRRSWRSPTRCATTRTCRRRRASGQALAADPRVLAPGGRWVAIVGDAVRSGLRLAFRGQVALAAGAAETDASTAGSTRGWRALRPGRRAGMTADAGRRRRRSAGFAPGAAPR
ncbi:MAG: hypothetical protein U0S48_11075 [Solirubrobacteraceae bacterium]